MKITIEKELKNFGFWSGGRDRAELLTDEELDTIENELSELYPDGMDETQLNDLFWFEFEFIAELIGETEETIFERDEKI